MQTTIRIRGARENNLKNISLDIPKHQLVVVTGPSGSGKSTLALDLLQRECQRQYLESSVGSADAIARPDVDLIEGLSPSIGVNQQQANRNPRSTVGTVTDLYTYLRTIFQKRGTRLCTSCQTEMMAPLDDTKPVTCPACQKEHDPFTKADFSFNTPSGACSTCSGLGTTLEINQNALFDYEKSLLDGAVVFWNKGIQDYYGSVYQAAKKHYGLSDDLSIPLADYSQVEWDLLLYGVESKQIGEHFPAQLPPKTATKGKFEGILTGMWRRYQEKSGESSEAHFFIPTVCPDCHGERLRHETRIVHVHHQTLPQLANRSLQELIYWIENVQTVYREANDSLLTSVLYDLHTKVKRILRVGLGYLTLDRTTITLSGGEAQRLRLASILGSGLTGVLYLLDEPTAGLHAKDTEGLIDIMKQLRDLGNTVLVIEHNRQVIERADQIIDVGPGAGRFGGEIVGQGTLSQLKAQPASITGRVFSQAQRLVSKQRAGNGYMLTIEGAMKHNLKNVNVSFPLGSLISVSGVSGSGKSSLIFDVLAVAKQAPYSGCQTINGMEQVDTIIQVGQTPLSRMQRSNIATYMDLFTHVRKLYAQQPVAKAAGLTAKHFSFNTAGGRCDRCEGLGVVDLDMHFLSHLQVTCPVCRGKRFKEEVLAVKLDGHSISDLLALAIEESLDLFKSHKKLHELLALLGEVGLGYLQWGQALTTLSGGEAQRIKLAKELSKKTTGHTLYLLDEPSSGLHPTDIAKLSLLLNKLVDAGNTVIMVEHHIDLIASSDWVIDMGPDGGSAGGQLVASGPPEEVARHPTSATAPFLRNE
ncbi:excinuclease ABC subunit A [Alkalihalobacillus xiaoxiensis]|uniref:UvrABC system protein A n=1 Tax=Shouchella xiaoxiensis TaxID=766895 RepID=A0ABS2SWY3_9BACI|nr:excinuclease ABC subunit UvrA [Shouchella xiaoxiensis]MBM7839516.1 excinuclease ABC subunit A [Shouchella xiaoxiensis]